MQQDGELTYKEAKKILAVAAKSLTSQWEAEDRRARLQELANEREMELIDSEERKNAGAIKKTGMAVSWLFKPYLFSKKNGTVVSPFRPPIKKTTAKVESTTKRYSSYSQAAADNDVIEAQRIVAIRQLKILRGISVAFVLLIAGFGLFTDSLQLFGSGFMSSSIVIVYFLLSCGFLFSSDYALATFQYRVSGLKISGWFKIRFFNGKQ